ncbi:hypothetical protein D3W54_09985 [Komagataeibacter medellinensis]|uniref:Transposase n=1 Tax=Komagataeibacter medellinensis TaxID=1177712 RepID=A0ABQ6VWG8_9PROT|nr:hypothetical protein D3W54_09985 [Komagataeibacter medellinensis]
MSSGRTAQRHTHRKYKEVFGEAFSKKLQERRLFEKRRHPKTFIAFYRQVMPLTRPAGDPWPRTAAARPVRSGQADLPTSPHCHE